jgi:hypothetical protein
MLVALPLLPVPVDMNVVTVPKLVMVTFLVRSKLISLTAVPLFVQVMSVAVVVQTNCAEAGAEISSAGAHIKRKAEIRRVPRMK